MPSIHDDPPPAFPQAEPRSPGRTETFDDIIEIEDDFKHRGRRFWRGLLFGFLGVLVLATVLAPRLASLSGPRNFILSVVNARIGPTNIEVADWRLRWVGRQTFEGIGITDASAGLSVDIVRAQLDAGLLRLIPMGHVNLGTVTVTQPVIQRRAPQPAAAPETANRSSTSSDPEPDNRSATSRAQEPAQTAAASPAEDGKMPRIIVPLYDLTLELRIIDGSADCELPGGESFGIRQLQATLAVPSLKAPCNLDASWTWNGAGGSVKMSGTLQQLRAALESPQQAAGSLNINLADNPMVLFAPLLVPHLGGVAPAAGRFSGSLIVTADGSGNYALETTAALDNLQATLPFEETPAMPPAQVRFAAQATLKQGRLMLNEVALVSPWATASANGNLALGVTPGSHPADEASLALRLELVPLMRDWGRLLKLNPALSVASGRLTADFAAGHDINGLWTTASAQATNLVLKVDQESITFTPPPLFNLRARRLDENRWQVDQFVLQSSFANITGAGSSTQAALNGNINLTRLSRDLHAIVPQLPRMVGQIAIAASSRLIDGTTKANGAVTFTDVAVDGGTVRPWVIDAGKLTASANSQPTAGTAWPREFSQVSVNFAGTPGSLTGSCARCEFPTTNRLDWLIQGGRMQANLDLGRTIKFISPLYTLPPQAELSGRAVVGVACEAAAGVIRASYNGAVQNLKLTSTTWDVREPDARLEGQAEWTASNRNLRIAGLTGRASLGTLGIPLAEIGQAAITGDVHANLDLAPLSRWRKPAAPEKAMQATGKLDIQAHAESLATGSKLTLDAKGSELTFTPAKGQAWSESAPAMHLAAQLPPNREYVLVKQLMLTNSLGYLQGTGSVTNGKTISLSGLLAVNCDTIQARLQERDFKKLSLKGFQARPFSFSAPLGSGVPGMLAYGEARLAIHLAKLDGYGINAKPDDLQARLTKGVVSVDYAPPLEKGSMKSALAVEVGTQPMVLQLPETAFQVKDIPLTDALLQLLAYVNPLLANCTVIEGRAGIEVSRGRIPLDGSYTRDTDFDAVITINDAVLMPSGVLEEILSYTGAAGKPLDIKQELLTATCRGGRIEIAPHQAMLHGNPVTFKGSVGLDQSILFQVVVPLTEDLVGDKGAKFIANQTLTIPVRGTIQKPRIDSEVLTQQIRKIATDAAQRALAEQAGDLMRKLREKIK